MAKDVTRTETSVPNRSQNPKNMTELVFLQTAGLETNSIRTKEIFGERSKLTIQGTNPICPLIMLHCKQLIRLESAGRELVTLPVGWLLALTEVAVSYIMLHSMSNQ